MKKSNAIGFPMALVIGILLGAVFDNMALGLLFGVALGFGWLGVNRNKS